MNVILSVIDHSNQTQEFRTAAFPVVVGRSSEADVTLTDRWVSRRHCVIDQRDGRLVVRDLGSKHGTLVNHALVEECPLLPGDKLGLGLSTIVAQYEMADGELAHHRSRATCDA
jgi:pSer/pThr/pTyr-binding forkhead associated (FHA) protein